MPRKPKSPNGGENEVVRVTLRIPKDVAEAFDKALELGYFGVRSRNEAIVKAMKNALLDIYFVMRAFEKAKEAAQSGEYQNSSLPKEFLHMKLALEILSSTPQAEEVNQRFASFIGLTISNLTTNEEDLKLLAQSLEKLFENSNQEAGENETSG